MKKIKSSCGDIIILHEDEDYLVINKPAGLIVHPAHDLEEENLASLLIKQYPEIKKVGEDPLRPGIVHRLDKEVSGVMLVIRQQKAFDYFKKQFQARKIYKEYESIVHGAIIKDEARINFPITRAKSGHKMAALPLPKKTDQTKATNREEGNEKARLSSKDAITDFKVEKKWPHISLVKVHILTGRTHQIRVHLAAYGYPILGDNLYGTAKSIRRNTKMNLSRIFLFAKKLSFIDNHGEQKTFAIDRPEEIENFLKKQK